MAEAVGEDVVMTECSSENMASDSLEIDGVARDWRVDNMDVFNKEGNMVNLDNCNPIYTQK